MDNMQQFSDQDFERIAALIKAEVSGSEARLNDRIAASETRILNIVDGRLDALEARLNDRIAQSAEATTTSLLTAFQQWASPACVPTPQPSAL